MTGLLTTREVAEMLKVSKQTVCKMAGQGRLKSFRVGNLLRFKSIDVIEFISQGGDNEHDRDL